MVADLLLKQIIYYLLSHTASTQNNILCLLQYVNIISDQHNYKNSVYAVDLVQVSYKVKQIYIYNAMRIFTIIVWLVKHCFCFVESSSKVVPR